MPITAGAVLETFNATEQATQTINLPTYSAGDVIVITVANNPNGTAAIGTITSGPTGFTEVGSSVTTGAASDGRLSRWIKVMNGTEGSSVSMTTSTNMSIGAIARAWEGVDNATPQDVTAPAYNASLTSPNVTTVTDGAVVIRSVLIDGAPGFSDSGIPSGHTLDGTIVQNPPSNGMNLGMAYEVQATAGGAGTAIWTGGGSEEAQAGTMVLRPLTNGVFTVDSDYGNGVLEFDYDDASLIINGDGFEATQGTGAVYISDADTLAGSVNEVDVSASITVWSNTAITLNLTTGNVIGDLQTLGPGTRYIIVTNNSSDEYGSPVMAAHRPKAFDMSLSGNFAPGTTTQRLTGLTGTFGGGRIEEALNPSSTNTDVASDGNREDVWNLEANVDARDVSYDFRVLYGGNVPNTITQTPQVTVTSVVIVTMSGTIQAQSSAISGGVNLLETLSGTIQSQASGISGDIERAITISGSIQSQISGVSGNINSMAMPPLQPFQSTNIMRHLMTR